MTTPRDFSAPITEDWLRSSGFKWEEIGSKDGPKSKHWLLWIAQACAPYEGETNPRRYCAASDLGIEMAYGDGLGDFWHVWVRADYAGRYTRFLHVRNMKRQSEVVELIEALTGRRWEPQDVLYGSFRSPEDAARLRQDAESLHMRLAKSWGERAEHELGITDKDKREIVR